MTEQVILDKNRFDEIFKFVIKAVKEDVPEEAIWATVEIMSSGELESSIRESERDIQARRARRFRTAKEAIDWLRS